MIATPHKFAGIPQPGEIQPDDEEAAAARIVQACEMLRAARTDVYLRRSNKAPAPYTIPQCGPAWRGDETEVI